MKDLGQFPVTVALQSSLRSGRWLRVCLKAHTQMQAAGISLPIYELQPSHKHKLQVLVLAHARIKVKALV